jgi:hypothetical protein
MLKRTVAVIITALVLGVAGGAIAESASATIIAKEGHYSGHDHNGNHIGFSYSRQHGMSHFTIGYSFTIGGAHVSNAMWHETCHGGYCTSGAWHNSTYVSGHYRHGGSSHKVAWSAHWIRSH